MADALAVSDEDTDEVLAGAAVDLYLLRPRREVDARLEAERDRLGGSGDDTDDEGSGTGTRRG